MGKAERNRAQNARQRIALQQQAARRAEAQRRAFIVGGSVLAVIVIVVAIVVIKSLHKTSAAPTASSTTTAKTVPTVATEITSVPEAVLNKVGAGPTGSAAVAPLKTITDKALTMNGKPEVLYMGAEYCPYCAAERWALAEALSRFGTFSNLHFIHSSSTDVYAATPTLTFYQSTYTSKYLTFDPIELETVSEAPLQKADAAQTALINKYTQGEFPFVDVGGKYIVDGAQYLPSTLGTNPSAGDISKTALTWQEVGSDMQNPNSSVGQEILGAANHVTAAICKLTGDQPSNVCKSASVTSIGGDI
jgi:thiol-disulfide isomerase/thioredoxin